MKNIIPLIFYSRIKTIFADFLKVFQTQLTSDNIKGVKNFETESLPLVFSVPISKETECFKTDYQVITVRVQFLGKFRIEINNKPLILNGKNALLLACLLLEFPREVHKETLMQRFWADNLSAKNSLNVAICNIRKAIKDLNIEQEIILFESNLYSVYPHIVMVTDVSPFKNMRQEAIEIMRRQGLSAAVGHLEKILWLYNGDFLENYPNDTWAIGERDTYFEYYFEAIRLLSEFYEKTGNLERCIEYCRQMLRHDPHFEPIHRRLIQAFQHLGAKDKAIRQYQECVKALKQINASPSKETRDLLKEMC